MKKILIVVCVCLMGFSMSVVACTKDSRCEKSADGHKCIIRPGASKGFCGCEESYVNKSDPGDCSKDRSICATGPVNKCVQCYSDSDCSGGKKCHKFKCVKKAYCKCYRPHGKTSKLDLAQGQLCSDIICSADCLTNYGISVASWGGHYGRCVTQK